jgi:hypothetical protein
MTIAGSSLSFLMEMAMADEKRQIGKSDICHRSRISLLDMRDHRQTHPYAPQPGLHPGHMVPAAQHKMELQAGGATRSPRPGGDNGDNADAMGLQNDAKSASRCTITVYARHQMEPPCSQDSTTQELVWCPQWSSFHYNRCTSLSTVT